MSGPYSPTAVDAGGVAFRTGQETPDLLRGGKRLRALSLAYANSTAFVERSCSAAVG
jgi:hypothetical protein